MPNFSHINDCFLGSLLHCPRLERLEFLFLDICRVTSCILLYTFSYLYIYSYTHSCLSISILIYILICLYLFLYTFLSLYIYSYIHSHLSISILIYILIYTDRIDFTVKCNVCSTYHEFVYFSLTIRCPKCRMKLVEVDDQLMFQAVHNGFSEKVLLYSWQLFRVAGGSASQIQGSFS